MSHYLTNRYGFNDHFFEDFFYPNLSYDKMLKTDIEENDKEYVLKMDVPEIKKEDLKISLKNGYVTIIASFKDQNSEKNKKYLQKERYYGSFSRSFYFGDTLQEEDVKAKLNQGVLTLHIFKKEKNNKKENQFISIEE